MLDRIKASLPSLAPAEQRVGKLVLFDPRTFASLPVTELALRAHVSKTVVRFCRSMGYDGLSDFKAQAAGTVSEGVPLIHRSVDVDDKVSDVLVKVIDNTVAAFLKYRNDASTHASGKRSMPSSTPHPQQAHQIFGRQFGHRGAGCPAQILPPGLELHCLRRWAHAGDERASLPQPRRLSGGDFQTRAAPAT